MRDHLPLWHSLRSMRRTEVQRRERTPLRFRHSRSLVNRRQRLSHAMVRSTIQRFGRTTNLCRSDRLRLSVFTWLQTVRRPSLNLAPWYPLSALVQQKGEEGEQRAHQQHAAVAVLDVGGVDDRQDQQALGIDQDVALLALDLLARAVARQVDAGPPFPAPFTLWLSMIAAVGLASRPACSRHCT